MNVKKANKNKTSTMSGGGDNSIKGNNKRRMTRRPSSSPSRSSRSKNHKSHELEHQRERRRRSRRGHSSGLDELATLLVSQQNVVFITGAGLSVASGVRPFRGTTGLWSQVVWTKATRESFRQNPLEWYNDFWIPHFCLPDEHYLPNAGHEALFRITQLSPHHVKIITQNIDGLQHVDNPANLIEAHGRIGLYKCLPDEDSDTDSDDDDDDDRLVHLGHRRKHRTLIRTHSSNLDTIMTTDTSSMTTNTTKIPKCKYEWKESMTVHELQPPQVRHILRNDNTNNSNSSTHTSKNTTTTTKSPSSSNNTSLVAKDEKNTTTSTSLQQPYNTDNTTTASTSTLPKLSHIPTCPDCDRPCPPQALLFDEGYHSHHFYQFTKMEDWLSNASAIVFVGTSFAVRITDVALEHARAQHIPVFNFNTTDSLESTVRLNATNIIGPSNETLPRLYQTCQDIQNGK